MRIVNKQYVREKVENIRKECIELNKKHEKTLKLMIINNTQENMDNYRDIRKKLDHKEFETLFYIDVDLLLNKNKTKNEIINEFKTRLNKENQLLKDFEKLYSEENPLKIGTPLYRKRIEVEELIKFMNKEIYN